MSCLICERIDLIKQGKNPYFVTELETGFVVIGDYQYYHGYTLFLCKKHTEELHQLPEDFRAKFLQEMSLVGEAVFKTFHPIKLNYELLGNKDNHLHWHIFPRYSDDPCPTKPVWYITKEIRCNEETKVDESELSAMVTALRRQIDSMKH